MNEITVNVRIEGRSALLMHRFPMEPVTAIEKMTKEEQTEIAAYRHPDTRELYIPAVCVQRALIAGGMFCKGKGRGSLSKNVAACVGVEPEYLLLGTDTYTIDSRSVVIAATKGRIVRHRPRLDTWAVDFVLTYDQELLSAAQMRDVVDATGSRVGLLDFRPEKKGPFGKFHVTKWA